MATIIMRNKKKLLILGATGFIGSNLINKYLESKKYKIYAVFNKRNPQIKHKNIKWIKANLTDFKTLLKITKGVDTIIQSAATTTGSKDVINKPYIHITDNVVMNAYLFRATHINSVKHLIFLSCTTMYKSSKKKQTEVDFFNPQNFIPQYFASASTKTFNEQMCKFYSNLDKTKFTVIRHSNIYGPFDKFDLDKSHFMGATITKVLKAKNIVEVWGNGQEGRDFLYIDDLTNFILKAVNIQKDKFQIYNCGSGKLYKINDIVKKIVKFSNKKLKIIHNKSKPSIPINIVIDSKKAQKDFNWKPRVSIEVGIKNTIAWWKKNY
jgi:GDP-L-fucose synthase